MKLHIDMRERESTRGIYVEDDPLYNTIRTPHPATTLTDAISSFSMSTIPNIRAGVLICFQYNIFHSEFLCLVLNDDDDDDDDYYNNNILNRSSPPTRRRR